MSSSPPNSGFAAFLGRSLALLEREAGPAFEGMCRAAAPRELLVRVDGEAVSLAFESPPPRLVRLTGPRAPDVELSATRTAILDLIDGRQSLVDAIMNDHLLLRGTPSDLIAFHDCLRMYLHGAFRARSFPALLREYRSASH